jgi:hypothetical protein
MPARLKIALGLEAVALSALLMVALDQYAHKRVESQAGVNIWGYRGPVMPARRPREFRIAVVGGEHAFGWGVAPEETMAGYLRGEMQRRMPQSGESRPVTAVNLGALGLRADEYASRLQQFPSLEPDVVCLYVDLVDRRPAATLPPYDSITARTTGYVPMLPQALDEKGQALAAHGATLRGAIVSAPGRVLRAVDRGLYHLVFDPPPAATGDRIASIGRALDAALLVAGGVVIILPPPMAADEGAAHQALRDSVQARAAVEPRLRVVDLAAAPGLTDAGLRIDGVNFGAGGHSRVASLVAPAAAAFIGDVAR